MNKAISLMVFLLACTPTEPVVEESKCPEGFDVWHWSYMDYDGVLTGDDLCLPSGTADSLFGGMG